MKIKQATYLLPFCVMASCLLHAESIFQPDSSTWYAFRPQNSPQDYALGLSTWNSERAGAKGRIHAKEDILFYGENPIKLWGLNNEFSDCYPEKSTADFRAAFYAKQGFNSVRQHKYNDIPGWGGIGTRESTVEFDPVLLDRFDYYNAKLMEKGLFINLSSNFGIKYGPADAHRFEAHDDFAGGENPYGRPGRISPGHGAVFFSPGLQELQIEQLVKLLNHTNPYTEKTYAEDPGVAFVEIFNEDSILFYGANGKLQQSPVLRSFAGEHFASWLKEKYGSEDVWHRAWNGMVVTQAETLKNHHLRNLIDVQNVKGDLPPESLEQGVIPWGQPWFWDSTATPSEDKALNVLRPRFLDTMEFLISLQDKFYQDTVHAIRSTGYTGEILSSNWQAGSMTGHFWNLRSDAKIGLIDRHNYFGGVRRGLQLRDGHDPVNNSTQLDRPGSGLLSSGMQQVGNRPFMLSEWNVVQPNEWVAEGPALVGTYGMGLQGWDVSYIFASYQDGGFSKNLDDVKKFSVDTPQIMGLMPAISRMVRRNDITESDKLAKRFVTLESLRTGEFDFNDFIEQAHDLKSFDGDKIPTETLAFARTSVVFDKQGNTAEVDFETRSELQGIRSATEQLFWSETEGSYNDYFTINTLGTQGFVGFAEAGDQHKAGTFSIQPEPGFQVILLTAHAASDNLATDSSALLVAMARARNTGMNFNEDGTTLLKVGKGPILLEPVKAKIDFGSLKVQAVERLDHDGKPTGKMLSLSNNQIELDTGRDQTPYYRVVFQ